MRAKITPLILTFDEAPNIERTLARLGWAKDIVVVDSASTDGTREILARFPSVRVFEHKFTTHADKWNFGLKQTGIRSAWVLALDADYVLSDDLVEELGRLDPDTSVAGFQARFKYCVHGTPLRGGAYPPVTVLYRLSNSCYVQDGHTQRLLTVGKIGRLKSPIFHDDRKPLARWFDSQVRNMRLEADKLLSVAFWDLGLADRLRRMIVVAPLAMLFFCLVVRGNILDGWPGIFYALQRTTAEAMLSLFLLQRKLDRRG